MEQPLEPEKPIINKAVPTAISKDDKFKSSPRKPFKRTRPYNKNIKESKFEKKQELSLTHVTPLQLTFELATNFFGILDVTKIFYNLLQSRDSKLTNSFTLLEFTYITLMAVYNRCTMLTNTYKTSVLFDQSHLKTLMEDVLLPDSIAQFVETFGKVSLSNSIAVIPYFRGIGMPEHPGYLNPILLLNRINREREHQELEPYRTHNNWLCPEIITKYMSAVSRALKNAIQLRAVDNKNHDGRNEFLAGYSHTELGIQCHAYDKISISECQLGAAFKLRQNGLTQEIGIPLPELFCAPEIMPESLLIAHFMHGLRTTK